MMIRRACSFDVASIVDLAQNHWKMNSEEELADEALSLIKAKNSVIFIAADESKLVGFAHCIAKKSISIDNKKRTHVAFLEAIYIKEEYLRQGIASEILENCMIWAKEINCFEMISEFDAAETNLIPFHDRMGFKQAENIVRYTKEL